MSLLKLHIVLLLLVVASGSQLLAQVTMFSRVNALPARYIYQTPDECGGELNAKSPASRLHWLAYSDSDGNTTYRDPFGREELGELSLMDPVLVIRRKNGYCKVVAYSPSVIDGSKGISGLLGKDKPSIRLTNRSEVEYLGWIKEDHLLHSSYPKVCASNLQPVMYFAGICHPNLVQKRSNYITSDSILLARAPGFRKPKTGKAPLHDWFYVYKRVENPPQYLIGTVPFIDKDSMQGTFGWVDDSTLLPLPQNSVLLPKPDFSPMANDSGPPPLSAVWTDERHAEYGQDTSRIDLLEDTSIEGTWFLPTNRPFQPHMDSVDQVLRTFIPLELIDLSRSRIYNCIGQAVTYQTYQELRKKLHTVNLLVVFEDGKEGKEAIGKMISSFQDIYQLIRKNQLEKYAFNFGAIGYNGRWVSETLDWTPSFSRWVEFIQQRAEKNDIDYLIYDHVMLRGIQEATRFLRGHQHEHNIVVVIGSKIDKEVFKDLMDFVVEPLSAQSANLLFVQPNRGKAHNYSDMVLQAKQILSKVGSGASRTRREIIIDNSLLTYRNEFKSMDRCGNGFLFDFPNRSMQKGGIFFPDAESQMCADVLRWSLDSLFLQIQGDTRQLLGDMADNFRTIGRLEQLVNPQLQKILRDQGIPNLPDSVSNVSNDPFYVEVRVDFDQSEPESNPFEPGYLMPEDQFEELVKSLRKVVIDPKLNREGDSEVDYKDRKRWSKELKRVYRAQNRFFQFKPAARNATLAEVIFMQTGYPVNNTYFHSLTVKSIGSRAGAEQEELRPEIEYFYRDIFELEGWPSEQTDYVIQRGGNKYFLIPERVMP